MIRNLIFILTVLSIGASGALAYDSCIDLLSSRQALEVKSEEGLVAYLGDLFENRVIGDLELSRFIQGLEKGEVINPISEQEALISSAAQIHREGIQKYLENQKLNQKQLLEWARKSISEKERVRVAREEANIVTQKIYRKIEFHPIRSGSFMMGEGESKVPVTLTHPFEMMPTAVTQKMWVELMGENPSRHKRGDHTVMVMINGKPISVQPDHPVENVTWWSAIVYANLLSVKAGLKPAYDLTGVKKFKKNTRAEEGTLDADLGEIKINAPDGNIYLAEGYRLPTEAEMEYVMKAAGAATGKYHFGDDEAELKNYAWYQENSNFKTHPVAELKPLVIDGKDFYDLHGNVSEWSQDWYDDRLIGGHNPQGAEVGISRVYRGGCHYNGSAGLCSDSRGFVSPRSQGTIGFRLVRTLKE